MTDGLTPKQFRLYCSDIQERATNEQLAGVIQRLLFEQKERRDRERAARMAEIDDAQDKVWNDWAAKGGPM